MDFIKGMTGGNKEGQQQQTQESTQKSSGGFMDKLNNMAGGGAKGEQKEDGLDKGIYVLYCSTEHTLMMVMHADWPVLQVSTGCRSMSLDKETSPTSPLWSRPRTNRSQVSEALRWPLQESKKKCSD